MDNKDVEVLDDFGFEDEPKQNVEPVFSNNNVTQEPEVLSLESSNKNENEKQEDENPVVEMINNKSIIRLIIIMLVILFLAVFFMPKVFELIGKI